MSDYETILQEYFDLKTRYEDKYASKKGGIINNKNISKKVKKELIDKIKLPCVGCGRQVNTIFYDMDRKYGATCGDTSKPCTLNIEIKKPTTMNVRDVLPEVEKELKNNEATIKKLKLYLLFGILDEEQTLSSYNSEKALYLENVDFRESMVEVVNLSRNIQEREENKKRLRLALYQHIKEIKENMSEYLINENKEGLNRTIEIYKNHVVSLLKDLRKNKYSFQDIEKIIIKPDALPEIVLKQEEFLTSDYEITQKEGEILNFSK